MKIHVDRVLPSPWRDFGRYPLAEERIQTIEGSIKDTGLWPVFLGRWSPTREGFVEMAFGHTRLEAAKRQGIRSIEIEIRELSDEQMLRIMVLENATQIGHDTPSNNHAVAQIARHLARELLVADALGGWAALTEGRA